jgi:hypothetical protein
MDILDQYVLGIPSRQNVLDLFDGEWSSMMPADSGLITRPGTAALFEDGRILWAEQQLGGFDGRKILELGPLECGHTFMLHERGALSIECIEANSRAFLKCLCIKELFGLHRANILLGDFVSHLKFNSDKYDITIASGVLYHMQDPIPVLDLILQSSDKVMIWTHYYEPSAIKASEAVSAKFGHLERASFKGFNYQFARYSYEKALQWTGFCGGSEPQSAWLTRNSIVDFLRHSGFTSMQIAFEDLAHPNGPCFAICAMRV